LEDLPVMRTLLHRYAHVVLQQTSQSGACNAHHSLRQRLCRWLLVARNALAADELSLTHEVMARLLGVRRASVTECLDLFQKEGMLKLQRGAILVGDTGKLEAACCDCYGLIMREYHRQLRKGGGNGGMIIRPQARALQSSSS
jgi:hypothetical protein